MSYHSSAQQPSTGSQLREKGQILTIDSRILVMWLPSSSLALYLAILLHSSLFSRFFESSKHISGSGPLHLLILLFQILFFQVDTWLALSLSTPPTCQPSLLSILCCLIFIALTTSHISISLILYALSFLTSREQGLVLFIAISLVLRGVSGT